MQKQRCFSFSLLLFFVVSLYAAYDETYYAKATGTKGAALKTALYGIIGNPDVDGYSSLWKHYYETDRTSNNQVIDRYSNEKRYFSVSAPSTDAVSGMNKEHGIPQSWWGGGTTGIGSDLQHVMPSDTEANSRKSNYGMGVVTSQSWTNGSIKVGKGTAGNNGTVNMWEPADEWKGDFARAYFYIVTAYEEKSLVQKEGANTMQANTYPKLQPWAYELYMKWSEEDPVSDLERIRNDVVDSIQGNRNPFVDYPGLEQYIWGDYKNVAFDAASYESPYGEGGTLVNPTASFAVGSISLTVGSTYIQTVTTNSDGTVTYESGNTNVATVNSSTGEVTAKAVGSTTITATIASSETYRPALVSYTVVVTKSGEDPMPITGNSYVRLSTVPSDWSGLYLIVYEGEGVAFDGALDSYDKTYNTIAVEIEDGVIAVTSATEAAEFIIAPSGSGYSIQGKSGKYMGAKDSSNGLATADTPYINTLSISNSGEAVIASAQNTYLRFNAADNQKRFRYYKTGQQSVSLFRRTEDNTGIKNLLDSEWMQQDNVIYDLMGRRILRVERPGVYLKGGHKILIKR